MSTMHKDFSYGIIPLRRINGKIECYLVKNKNGSYWGFPKGHAEGSETPKVAAERELLEETGLNIISWIESDSLEESYIFTHQGQLVEKKVFYFIAEVTKVAVIQLEEILDGRWFSLDEVEETLTYEASKNVFAKAKPYIIFN